jgi:small subunit ribosomal protein S9
MADEERREGDEGQASDEGAPEGDEQAPEAEEQAPEEPAGDETSEPPAEQPAEEVTSPPAEPAQEGEDNEAEAKQPESKEGEGKEGEGDLPPGAELEPIAIEADRELSAEERARVEAEAEERARREAEATAEAGEEEPAPRRAVQLESDARFGATGKRKSSIARVIVLPGNGQIEVNTRSLEEYFPRSLHQSMARQPLVTAGYDGNVDVRVRVHGGGIAGQAGAVRHGIARALCEIDPELRRELKRRGFLTRDAREKERRKAGLKKARKRPQFSKR